MRQLAVSTSKANQFDATRRNGFKPLQSAVQVDFEPVKLSGRIACLCSSNSLTAEKEETGSMFISNVPGNNSRFPLTACLSGRRRSRNRSRAPHAGKGRNSHCPTVNQFPD